MPSQEYERLEQCIAAGDWGAVAGIAELAKGGDPDAEFRTAEFRLRGLDGYVDLEGSLALMASAAGKGHAAARRSHAYFIAAGIGCCSDSDRARQMLEELGREDPQVAAQLAFLDRMGSEQRVKAADRRRLSNDPLIEIVSALFTPEECHYVQRIAEPLLEPAMIYSDTGQGIRDPHRDSDNMVIAPMAEDLVIHRINRCIAEASGTAYNWGEPLHVLRYGPGQQYRPHFDALDSVPVRYRRIATALLYLNDDYEGGETVFPRLDIKVRGSIGDVLIFHNLTDGMDPDPRMLHAGLPVVGGEKWLATRWIRCGDFFGRPDK